MHHNQQRNTIRTAIIALLLISLTARSFAQSTNAGRVLINEYLPWTNNGCGATAEFIELFNFGPGPVNLSGYIVTDGEYAITIPPNTILPAGKYFVLSGQNTIPINCGNDARSVTVNLNWNTCGCTSQPIPTTGEGMLTDGGSGNEQIVLLDSNLQIIDAIVRNTPVEPSQNITTSSIGGHFTPRTFDLDLLNPLYETIGESVGRGNSLARKIDGGCGWMKDTQESAGDQNNTPAETLDWTGNMNLTVPSNCTGPGSISLAVSDPSLFPMTYLLARDLDSNFIYDEKDLYTSGIDSAGPNIDFNGLQAGSYSLVVGSRKGCDIRHFGFSIINCASRVLEEIFREINLVQSANGTMITWNIPNRQLVSSFTIEKSSDGRNFTHLQYITDPAEPRYKNQYFTIVPNQDQTAYYRIRLHTTTGAAFNSRVLTVKAAAVKPVAANWVANPFVDQCSLLVQAVEKTTLYIRMINTMGAEILSSSILLQKGNNFVTLPAQKLAKGIYMLQLRNKQGKLITVLKGEKRG